MEKIKGNIDLLMISETKLDDSFAIGQFYIDGFGLPKRLDWDKYGGGVMLYSRDIPIKLLLSEVTPSEGFCVEMNLYKKNWLINCSYNPSKHIAAMKKILDLYSTKYEIIVLGDFNVEAQNKYMIDVCKRYSFRRLSNRPKCFKNSEKPSCIDLVLKKSLYNFQKNTSFFSKIVVNLIIPEYKGLATPLDDNEDPILEPWNNQKTYSLLWLLWE